MQVIILLTRCSSRIAQKDIQALNELKALAKDNTTPAGGVSLFMSTALLCRKIRYQAIKYYEQACHVEETLWLLANARYFYLHGPG